MKNIIMVLFAGCFLMGMSSCVDGGRKCGELKKCPKSEKNYQNDQQNERYERRW